MSGKNTRLIRIINVFSDAVLILLAYVLAMFVRYRLLGGDITVNPYEGRFLLIVSALGLPR